MAAYLIEFVGGPFDGYGQLVSVRPDDLAPDVALPVSSSIFRLLDGQPVRKNTRPTSIAFYRQDLSDGRMRYRFLGSRSPLQLHIGISKDERNAELEARDG
jgi:hypothetical protein